jgi:hypothetical protein
MRFNALRASTSISAEILTKNIIEKKEEYGFDLTQRHLVNFNGLLQLFTDITDKLIRIWLACRLSIEYSFQWEFRSGQICLLMRPSPFHVAC